MGGILIETDHHRQLFYLTELFSFLPYLLLQHLGLVMYLQKMGSSCVLSLTCVKKKIQSENPAMLISLTSTHFAASVSKSHLLGFWTAEFGALTGRNFMHRTVLNKDNTTV